MKFQIKEAREMAGFSQKELAERIGVAPNTFHGYESGKHDPKSDLLAKIAGECGVSVDFLLGLDTPNAEAKGEIFPEISEEALTLARDYDTLDDHGKRVLRMVADEEKARIKAESQATQPAHDPEPEENVIRFPMPFYLQPSSAGFGDWADSEYAEKVMLVKEPPFGAAFIIPVNGDSMEPTYPDGCKVFVRPQHEVREGQVGIFYMDGKLWIKELGSDALISHNPDYPPQPFQEDLRCWGLVVGICDDSYFEH